MFNVGDKVTSIWEPHKVATIKSIDTMTQPESVYTVLYEDGNEYSNYAAVFKKVMPSEDALRYGEVLTDDMVFGKPKGKSVLDIDWIRIRTILYESRIFYHKMVNGEVAEFKELTR